CVRPAWFNGAPKIKIKSRSRAQRPTGRLECLKARSKAKAKAKSEADAALLFCGSWLACDADTSVYQADPVDAIAGKPAPTFDRARFSF
ncbi:hypothetical protein ACI2KL_28685, partial [Pseudomonas yamanorum]